MKNRRQFIKLGALTGGLLFAKSSLLAGFSKRPKVNVAGGIPQPIVLSTWNHGIAANDAAWTILNEGGKALDAVEKGVRVTESDPKNRSVGLGGLPDRDGHVTLDACIMDERSRAGSVAFLQHIENPISVARKVMEDTPHVMLVGEGALSFALDKGFEKTNLLTDGARKEWESWRKKSNYQPLINIENHDTIGMIGMDAAGNLSGACTTSGLSYKMHGRVGDSPIIGAGLFVDNEVGAATATGMGEAVIRIAGSHTVVELMRQGVSPEEACRQAVERIMKKHDDITNLQVGFIALNKKGEYGGYSIYGGFNYALRTPDFNGMVDAKYKKEW